MYGMVNNAIKELVIHDHGEDAWQLIRKRAGLADDVFLSAESYPDEITYSLVAAVSEELDAPAEAVLHQFGKWWVLHTGRGCYGHLMEGGGRSLGEFLRNLPNFHTRIILMYPDLKPPEFECSDEQPGSVRLHYRSTRKGLAPFVVGLIHGLGEMFSTPVDVIHETKIGDGADHDVFFITWPATGSPS